MLSRVEEKSGWRHALLIVGLAYFLHVISMSLLKKVFGESIEIMGLSSIIYTAIGFFFKENLRYSKSNENKSFVLFLALMVVIDVAIGSVIVHSLALAFGLAVSLVMSRHKYDT